MTTFVFLTSLPVCCCRLLQKIFTIVAYSVEGENVDGSQYSSFLSEIHSCNLYAMHSFQHGSSMEEFLEARRNRKSQPYLLAGGTTRCDVTAYYVVIDHQALPSGAHDPVGALDALFKAHYIFGLEYSAHLQNFWTFIQTTWFNIDVDTTRESPRVREVRSKLQAT